MQNYLAQFGEWVMVIQGVVFVACVLAFRRGIVGELAALALTPMYVVGEEEIEAIARVIRSQAVPVRP